ncbi:MAG: hypothetical protein E2O35_01720 [Proteobacteria bacterium]|nr:MAG: hypothetical protein E2O35_01720 [Pseudomonadota bacterium]
MSSGCTYQVSRRIAQPLAREAYIDHAIDHHVGDINATRPEFAHGRFGEPPWIDDQPITFWLA